ncbi:MAG: hypothetical protein ACXVHB_26385 [Solirubrobacteraceae bacterium]
MLPSSAKPRVAPAPAEEIRAAGAPVPGLRDAEHWREMCREEVRLNRRVAPNLYLGVRSAAAHEQGLELAAKDDPRAVDYLVEMRCYDEERRLAAKLERGELRRGEVVRLGRMLARFNERARRVAAGGAPALEQFAWRARLPLVIVICGAPAAGKSRLAGALPSSRTVRT